MVWLQDWPQHFVRLVTSGWEEMVWSKLFSSQIRIPAHKHLTMESSHKNKRIKTFAVCDYIVFRCTGSSIVFWNCVYRCTRISTIRPNSASLPVSWRCENQQSCAWQRTHRRCISGCHYQKIKHPRRRYGQRKLNQRFLEFFFVAERSP